MRHGHMAHGFWARTPALSGWATKPCALSSARTRSRPTNGSQATAHGRDGSAVGGGAAAQPYAQRRVPHDAARAPCAAVLDAASAGDVVAHDIVVEIGTVLGEYARVAARKRDWMASASTLSLQVAVSPRDALLRTMIASALPNAKLLTPRSSPQPVLCSWPSTASVCGPAST